MNRRELLKSSAKLAAAVVGCIPQETKPVVNLTTRLTDDCYVDFRISGYPPEGGSVWSSPNRANAEEIRERVNEIWRHHRAFDQTGFPMIVHGGID